MKRQGDETFYRVVAPKAELKFEAAKLASKAKMAPLGKKETPGLWSCVPTDPQAFSILFHVMHRCEPRILILMLTFQILCNLCTIASIIQIAGQNSTLCVDEAWALGLTL